MPAKKSQTRGIQLPQEVVAARRGAGSGIHADQSTRRFRVGLSNRVNTRSAQVRAAVRFDER